MVEVELLEGTPTLPDQATLDENQGPLNKVFRSIDNGLSAYHSNASVYFESTAMEVWELDPTTGEFSYHSDDPTRWPATFSGLPFATYEFAPSAGGLATLENGTRRTHFLTATLWGAPAAPP